VGSIQLAHHQDRKFSAQSLLLLESASLLVGKTLHHFDVEEELVRSMARFRSMFERHHSVMLLVDSDSGAILDANQAAERFYGHSRAKLMEMSLGELEVTESGEVGRKGKGVDLKEGKASLVNHCLAGGDVRIVEIHPSRISMDEQSRTFCIIHDVTERHQLQRLVLDVGDQERQRIGRDLHDSLGGSLSGLAMLSKALEQRLLANGAEDAELAGEIASGIKDAIGQTRSIARGLCPVGLSSVGFLQGLQDFAHGVQRRSGVKCSLKVPEEVSLREEFAATHLFHIVAEATNNALRHGRAGEVRIVVAERRSILTVSVEDDGIGISRTSDRSMGMGLRTMQYRADVIGAKLEIVSVEPHGTRISCILPLVLPDSNTAFRRKGN
jgi:PAS domain S-box-containing protein